MTGDLHTVALVGAGRVGRALAEYVHERGLHLSAVIDSDRSRCDAVHAPVDRRSTSLDEIPDDTDVVMICVPDAAISAVSTALAAAGRLRAGTLCTHASGLLPASSLQTLQDASMCIGNLHPIQSFPHHDVRPEDLRGIGCGIEGGEDFVSRILPFCATLEWNPVQVDPRSKAAYHAACVMAGNFPVVLAAQAEAILHNAGIDASFSAHLRPMMQTVIDRLAENPPASTLSGPAARGDWETMRRHLEALTERHPEALALYRVLTEAALHLGGADSDIEFFQ